MIYDFDGLTFQILTIDRFYYKEGFFDVKPRPYASISFRLKGKGVFDFGDKGLTIEQGDILFLPADTPYKVEYSVGECIVAHLRDCNYFEPEKLSFEGQTATELLFCELLEHWQANHSVNGAKSEIYNIFKTMEVAQGQLSGNAILRLCTDLMEEKYLDSQLTIDKICKTVSVSRSGLQRLFNEYFKLSPKQYLLNLRMNKAVGLLMENGLSVKEIAFACGFSDEKYFSRAFKKRYGYPPSQLQVATLPKSI